MATSKGAASQPAAPQPVAPDPAPSPEPLVSAAAPALPPVKDAAAPGVLDLVEYKAPPGVALPTLGKVALENWCGVLGNKRVRVYRGAVAGELPAAVVKAMATSGCKTGSVTWAELGVKPPVSAVGASGNRVTMPNGTVFEKVEPSGSNAGGF